MSDNNIKTLKILKKYNYIVRVEQQSDESVYKVTYPPFNIFEQKHDSFTKEYKIDLEGVVMDGERVGLPSFLKRVGIIADVYSQCYYLKINPSLICYFNNKGEEKDDFFALNENLLEKDELTKEQIIYKMLVQEGNGTTPEEQAANFRSWKIVKGLSL